MITIPSFLTFILAAVQPATTYPGGSIDPYGAFQLTESSFSNESKFANYRITYGTKDCLFHNAYRQNQSLKSGFAVVWLGSRLQKDSGIQKMLRERILHKGTIGGTAKTFDITRANKNDGLLLLSIESFRRDLNLGSRLPILPTLFSNEDLVNKKLGSSPEALGIQVIALMNRLEIEKARKLSDMSRSAYPDDWRLSAIAIQTYIIGIQSEKTNIKQDWVKANSIARTIETIQTQNPRRDYFLGLFYATTDKSKGKVYLKKFLSSSYEQDEMRSIARDRLERIKS
jgi:hypothetical protein